MKLFIVLTCQGAGILLVAMLLIGSTGVLSAEIKTTRQDELMQLYQTVDFLGQRVDQLDNETRTLFQWAKACENRIIEGEKREAQLERRVRKLEGRLYGP